MFNLKLHAKELLKRNYRQTALILSKPIFISFILIYLPWSFLIKYDLHIQFRRILIFWSILVLIYFTNKYLIWLLNSYLVTNQRLIVIIYRHLFQKQVIESPIERILNISFKQKGILPSVLNYGDVEVQIVGLVDPLIFRHVKKPAKVKDFLWGVHNEFSGKKITKEDLPKIEQQIGYYSKKKK